MIESSHSPPVIRVLIAEDHPVMRHGLTSALSREVSLELVGEAVDGADAVAKFRALKPTVTLMDLQMAGMDGLRAIELICKDFPDANIIVLTSYPGDARIMRALSLGATSYLLKSATIEEIVKTIRASVAGRHVIGAEAAHELTKHIGGEVLTVREVSVLRLVARGQSNREIAGLLAVSEETIKSRMRSIMSKLGALDRANAVMIAVQRGFIDP
jgi:DNA-binding NarL/FixJ family response regulator